MGRKTRGTGRSRRCCTTPSRAREPHRKSPAVTGQKLGRQIGRQVQKGGPGVHPRIMGNNAVRVRRRTRSSRVRLLPSPVTAKTMQELLDNSEKYNPDKVHKLKVDETYAGRLVMAKKACTSADASRMSVRAAAKVYTVPRSTLRAHVNAVLDPLAIATQSGRPCIISPANEVELILKLKQLRNYGKIPLTPLICRHMVRLLRCLQPGRAHAVRRSTCFRSCGSTRPCVCASSLFCCSIIEP